MKNSGCEEGGVVIDVRSDTVNCQFERGACMTATFGGRSADFVTYDPIRAKTKISFMFGTPLDSPAGEGAAAAIVNVATGFFCLSRVLHSCPESSHTECYRQLLHELGGKRIFCMGSIPAVDAAFRSTIVKIHRTRMLFSSMVKALLKAVLEISSGPIKIQKDPLSRPFNSRCCRLNQLSSGAPLEPARRHTGEKSCTL